MHQSRPRQSRVKSRSHREFPLKPRLRLLYRQAQRAMCPRSRSSRTFQGKEGPMAKMMTKSELAGTLGNKCGPTKKQSAMILEELATLAARQAKNGFVFPGVGKLVVVRRKARMGRNPQTGEPIKIPAKTVLKFRIAKAMKELALK